MLHSFKTAMTKAKSKGEVNKKKALRNHKHNKYMEKHNRAQQRSSILEFTVFLSSIHKINAFFLLHKAVSEILDVSSHRLTEWRLCQIYWKYGGKVKF